MASLESSACTLPSRLFMEDEEEWLFLESRTWREEVLVVVRKRSRRLTSMLPSMLFREDEDFRALVFFCLWESVFGN